MSIPRIIHCVWLSGEEKPQTYKECIESWKRILPDYEIKEWSISNLPGEVLNHQWVRSAIENRKWTYAADYIRTWALYTFGGIYLDMDVYVFKSLDVFLHHRAFSCAEFSYKRALNDGKRKTESGLAIEGAVMGAEKGHPFLGKVLDYYAERTFVNKQCIYIKSLYPEVLKSIAKAYFDYVETPNYQILKDDVHIYPSETFSFLDNWADYWLPRYGNEALRVIGENPVRYALHLTLHSWWSDSTWTKIVWNVRRMFTRKKRTL